MSGALTARRFVAILDSIRTGWTSTSEEDLRKTGAERGTERQSEVMFGEMLRPRSEWESRHTEQKPKESP